MLATNRPIFWSRQVGDAVHQQTGLEVGDQLVRHVMRKDLRLGYRLAKTVAVQSNAERCLVRTHAPT